MFLTKEQFAKVLELTPEVGHKHFSYFDQTRRGRVSATEIWGALALCCSDREEPKVSFIYGLMDLDRDGALNRVELTLLLHAVGKGVARMKQIAAPPRESVSCSKLRQLTNLPQRALTKSKSQHHPGLGAQ